MSATALGAAGSTALRQRPNQRSFLPDKAVAALDCAFLQNRLLEHDELLLREAQHDRLAVDDPLFSLRDSLQVLDRVRLR